MGKAASIFDGVGTTVFTNINDVIKLGTLTHENFPINGAASGATMQITLTFSDPVILPVKLTYDLLIDETTNKDKCRDCIKNYQPCYDDHAPCSQSSTPCPDKVYWSNTQASQSFQIGDTWYTLVIDGFKKCDGTGTTINEFITQEYCSNAACLYGHLEKALTAIEVVKKTNGQIVTSAPGPTIPVGSPVNWQYVVTNRGDTALSSVTVTDSKSVTVTCSKSTLAVGESMTCTASGTAISGQYQNIASASGKDPANHLVTDTDTSYYFGCTSPTTLAGVDKAVCVGGSVQIGGEAAATGYTYSWSPTAGLDVASSARPTATPSVTTTYTVTKTNTATGCFGTDSMIVTVNPKPTALAGVDKAVCVGGSVQIGGEAAATGYTYSWSPSTGLDVASSAQPTATPSVTTTYTVTKTNTATGCFATDSMIVTVNPKPTALAGDDKAVCTDGSVQIGGEAAATGYTYSWSPSAGLDVASSAQPTATPSVTTTYTVTKTNTATGCFATDSMIVTVNPKPTALAGDDKTVCVGGSVQIGGEAAVTGYTYSWSPSAGLDVASSAQPTATPSVTTTYTVTKTNTATGCFATDSMIVTVNPKPTALAGDDKAVCAGGSVQIGGEAAATGYTYSWSPSTGLDVASSAQPTATPAGQPQRIPLPRPILQQVVSLQTV